MIIKKIKHPYRDESISTNKEPKNTSKIGKKLCFLSSPPKIRPNESKEDWAKRFLEKIATDLEGAADRK
jgi:hypothetical protein